MQEILGLELPELSALVEGPAYRSAQIFEWIYAKSVQDFGAMSNLPQPIRNTLAERFTITLPGVRSEQHATDGTTKYALDVSGETIEAVHMPEEKRDTICISSQAGCSFGCTFCVTARMNLRRNLTAGEIVGEVLLLLKQHGRDKRLNIVFMGMGEPLHNYDQVMKAFRLMIHPRGMAISPRRITLSTVGLVPAMRRLKDEPVIPNLAVSLNAPNDRQRNELMPINRSYPLAVLLGALQELPLQHRQRVTFEYVMLKDVNDSEQHAKELARLIRDFRCKVNLIPLNPDSHLSYGRPDDETVSRFAGVLVQAKRTVSVRRSRGLDISAACGQLGTQFIDPARVPRIFSTTDEEI